MTNWSINGTTLFALPLHNLTIAIKEEGIITISSNDISQITMARGNFHTSTTHLKHFLRSWNNVPLDLIILLLVLVFVCIRDSKLCNKITFYYCAVMDEAICKRWIDYKWVDDDGLLKCCSRFYLWTLLCNFLVIFIDSLANRSSLFAFNRLLPPWQFLWDRSPPVWEKVTQAQPSPVFRSFTYATNTRTSRVSP